MYELRVCKIHTLVSFLRLAEVKGVKGEAGTSSLERVAVVHERTCGEQSGIFKFHKLYTVLQSKFKNPLTAS